MSIKRTTKRCRSRRILKRFGKIEEIKIEEGDICLKGVSRRRRQFVVHPAEGSIPIPSDDEPSPKRGKSIKLRYTVAVGVKGKTRSRGLVRVRALFSQSVQSEESQLYAAGENAARKICSSLGIKSAAPSAEVLSVLSGGSIPIPHSGSLGKMHMKMSAGFKR